MDENNFTADELQQFTYNSWCSSPPSLLSIPPPPRLPASPVPLPSLLPPAPSLPPSSPCLLLPSSALARSVPFPRSRVAHTCCPQPFQQQHADAT